MEVGAGGGVLDVVSVEADYDRLPVTQDNLRRERLNPAASAATYPGLDW